MSLNSCDASRLAVIVDADTVFASQLRSLVQEAGYDVIVHDRFEAARRQLAIRLPSTMIANVRLESFNGIHLAYLAKSCQSDVCVIIYAGQHDRVLARESQRAGAFYERQSLLPQSIKRLVVAVLPPADRRNADIVDRRAMFRGGRRATDLAITHLAPVAM